ncbi:MAG TPA: hypothetical protein VJG90_01345 [Candidatus Nanoarchaeia archaeon]|nr:hypothetical protein [Candidatus Nanoarchaeia archaeon]
MTLPYEQAITALQYNWLETTYLDISSPKWRKYFEAAMGRALSNRPQISVLTDQDKPVPADLLTPEDIVGTFLNVNEQFRVEDLPGQVQLPPDIDLVSISIDAYRRQVDRHAIEATKPKPAPAAAGKEIEFVQGTLLLKPGQTLDGLIRFVVPQKQRLFSHIGTDPSIYVTLINPLGNSLQLVNDQNVAEVTDTLARRLEQFTDVLYRQTRSLPDTSSAKKVPAGSHVEGNIALVLTKRPTTAKEDNYTVYSDPEKLSRRGIYLNAREQDVVVVQTKWLPIMGKLGVTPLRGICKLFQYLNATGDKRGATIFGPDGKLIMETKLIVTPESPLIEIYKPVFVRTSGVIGLDCYTPMEAPASPFHYKVRDALKVYLEEIDRRDNRIQDKTERTVFIHDL